MDSTAKIQAIKLIRDKTDIGLHAAKLAIEAYAAEHPRATFGEIVDAVVSADSRGPTAPTYAELAAENARLRAALEEARRLVEEEEDRCCMTHPAGQFLRAALANQSPAETIVLSAARAATTPQHGAEPGGRG